MKYIDVNWFHSFEDEPYRLVSEIGLDQYETRKLEFWRNGKVGFADSQYESENTRLGTVVVTNLEEINIQNEFQGKYISKQEFEALWKKYVQTNS